MKEYIALRPAQKSELQRLLAQKTVAENQLKTFTTYLADDLDARIQDGWTGLTPENGFEREVTPQPLDKKDA